MIFLNGTNIKFCNPDFECECFILLSIHFHIIINECYVLKFLGESGQLE